ncbi:OLC1v1030513C1 [Oldenlandia corymbosa var. corymbosa]|uniref:non-reducing end alpha-L-arabinofuranosidase n=1 Tax=Oldenlandia corymbosa var. corymbosa TaxID=529605 RepID=A0AAV1CH00_OLDCO|nr:OLC1v1030513C1 [Oldenlandia corymbosa var. corymbosa]
MDTTQLSILFLVLFCSSFTFDQCFASRDHPYTRNHHSHSHYNHHHHAPYKHHHPTPRHHHPAPTSVHRQAPVHHHAMPPTASLRSSGANTTATLTVDWNSRTKMPPNLFGIFFEEINHAGTGGLWAELVSNRGFEAKDSKGNNATIDPWGTVGGQSDVKISTDHSSLFPRNKIALKVEVLCERCPDTGVGVFNPGYWGMNIVKGKHYKVTLYVRGEEQVDMLVALAEKEGFHQLASHRVQIENAKVWQKVEFTLKAHETDHYARLTITSKKKGVFWLDQVSVMPADTHLGHGFRNDIFNMIQDLSPGFIRFPGGNYVEGDQLNNCLDWKHTLGPWENRPGHYNDAWGYWTDDGMGHFEYFQLAEDLGALPIWVFSIGVSISGLEVEPKFLYPYIQDALDGLEFALGDKHTTWGSVRAAMGHPEPFDLRYVAPGNEDCGKPQYDANYRLFFSAIREAYPDIQIITNCDGSSQQLTLPADIYDYHTYPQDADEMFNEHTHFDKSPRKGAKAFVSEYAVWGNAPGKGNVKAALAESAFLMGLEKNCDIVEFASYAPLLVNDHDRAWNPDAIVFDASQVYGTPSYWMQTFFKASNNATYLKSTLSSAPSQQLLATAILWRDPSKNNELFLRIKVVNFGRCTIKLKIIINKVGPSSLRLPSSHVTVMGSDDPLDENSFASPNKVKPFEYPWNNGGDMEIKVYPHTLTALDIAQDHTGEGA